jgi:hypothetical protein
LQADNTARDRYAKAAQKYVSEHMALHGDPRKKMLAIPLVLVGTGTVFISIFNGVRVLMNSGVSVHFHFTVTVSVHFHFTVHSQSCACNAILSSVHS